MFIQIGIFMDSIKQIEIKNRLISFATYYNEYSFLNMIDYILEIYRVIYFYLLLFKRVAYTNLFGRLVRRETYFLLRFKSY